MYVCLRLTLLMSLGVATISGLGVDAGCSSEAPCSRDRGSF
jgi:hypothetical protein